jgi:S1-C subfamily serine protease
LVDLDGQVIGIADAGMLKAQGIGYVVPSGKAAPYLEAAPTEQPLATCY